MAGSDRTPNAPSDLAPEPAKGRTPTSRGRRAALLLIGLLALVVLQGLAAGFFFVRDMRTGAAYLRGALRDMKASEFRSAEERLGAAGDVVQRARQRLDAPGLALLERAGPFRNDLVAARTLADVAFDVARSGEDSVRAAGINDLDDIYDDGVIDLDAIARVAAATEDLRSDLQESAGRLVDLRDEGVAAPIQTRVARTERLLAATWITLRGAGEFLEMVPAFAGAEDPKRYFVAFQSPSEARGGGGLIGVYGILSATEGRFDLADVNTIETLVRAQREVRRARRAKADRFVARDVPPWFRTTYGPFGTLDDWRQINLSPNFPVTAELILDMYEADVGERLDGVIALDPLALGELTRGTGPLVAPGWDRRITRASARRFLLHDIYRHFDFREREQNEYLNRLIEEFWDALGSDDVRVGGLVRGLAAATSTQHLKLYARDTELQAHLQRLGATGNYLAPGVQLLFHNNFAGNKVDFFLRRTVDTEISLRADGSARVTVRIELANEADDAPPGAAALVRPFDRALPFGTNRMLLGVMTPSGSAPGTIVRDGRRLVPITGREGRSPVALQVVEVPAGDSVEVIYHYDWPTAWVPDRFTFTLWPQATVRPDFFSLTVEPPPGMTVEGQAMHRIAGRLQAPVTIHLELLPE